MQKILLLSCCLLLAGLAQAQERFPANQLSINGFRNPSIGLEYHRRQASVHAGYYLTNFESGVTTRFLKAGLTYCFLPWGKQKVPSSLYAGASYLRGLSRDYEGQNAAALEAGAKFIVWRGLNLRLGGIALVASGQRLKVNPTPSINYSIAF
jgi:hypothetical protein